MQRVNRSTAVATLPIPPAGGTPGYFAQPNPTGGVPATIPGYEWFNAVQEELLAVIEGQGLSASSANLTQLRQAILKMVQAGQKAVVISGVTFAPAVTSSGMAVYWDTVNNCFDRALADGSAKQAAVGFSDIVNGAVYALGDAVLFTGLTPGHYYLSGTVAGSITATVPTTNVVSVGVAKSATEMFVDIDAAGGINQTQADVRYANNKLAFNTSVAGNALTGVLTACPLTFRNPILTNGTPVEVTLGANLSMTVPSGATLGLVNGVPARLVWLVAYNAGTPVLCVVNLAGGNQLDETNLISPTTISGSANAANIIYSSSAVAANSPYSIVGFCDITETTAGIWASAATINQGTGGEALAAMSSLGYGQTWKDVTASRAVGTTYYNTTNKPISVQITSAGSGSVTTCTLTCNGMAISNMNSSSSFNASAFGIIPPGGSYVYSGTAVNTWYELR